MNSNQYSISQTSAVSIKEIFCNELYRLKSGLKTFHHMKRIFVPSKILVFDYQLLLIVVKF